jgi:hypothetical protein
MAKLPEDNLEVIWTLLKHLSQLVEDASEAEYLLFERFGETDDTLACLEELKAVALEAASRYSQLANLRLRLAEIQPSITNDRLISLEQVIQQNQLRIPAMERSIQEIKIEWQLL